MTGNGHIDRLPPHSEEAEAGTLGCMLISPNEAVPVAQERLGRSGEAFYDMRHQTLYCSLTDMFERGHAIDTLTLRNYLKDKKILKEAGGIEYVTQLPDQTPSAANLTYYTNIVFEKFMFRRMIHACTNVVGSIYEAADYDTVIHHAQRELLSALNPITNARTEEHWSMRELMGFDPKHDPNAVIGFRDGTTTRYLCRGYSRWIIGQSHVGKSSLGIQEHYMWALNRPFCGITPVRDGLRVLIVQNENDQGDCAEATQGIMNGLIDRNEFSTEMFDILNDRVKVVRCRGRTGAEFTRWLERQIIAWKADLVYIDPLLRYAGIDVSRQDQVTKFLNNNMDPVLANTGVVMSGAHHTGKPKNEKESKSWTVYDMAYAGMGSSELVNWARAITVIKALPDKAFEVHLAKRGGRAFASHPGESDPTLTLYLKHSEKGIFWDQIAPPDQEETPSTDSKTSIGRPSKTVEYAGWNLFDFCAACTAEGEKKTDIAKRLEKYMSKQRRTDISFSMARRVIEALVSNGKLLKNDAGLYLVGPNA